MNFLILILFRVCMNPLYIVYDIFIIISPGTWLIIQTIPWVARLGCILSQVWAYPLIIVCPSSPFNNKILTTPLCVGLLASPMRYYETLSGSLLVFVKVPYIHSPTMMELGSVELKRNRWWVGENLVTNSMSRVQPFNQAMPSCNTTAASPCYHLNHVNVVTTSWKAN